MLEELRLLRSRAYGPAADIHSDPQALARLAELERAHREVTRAPGPATVDPAPPPQPLSPGPRTASGASDAAPTAPAPAETPPDAPTPARRRTRPMSAPRWAAILWPVSLIAALALGAAATSAAMPLVSREGAITQVSTLAVDPDFEWPENFLGPSDGTSGYEDFLGLTAMTTTGGQWQPEGTDACILLMATDELDTDGSSFSGRIYNGCGAGAFPATVVLTVDESMPAALQSRFPVGTALQFVFDGERVGVFRDATG